MRDKPEVEQVNLGKNTKDELSLILKLKMWFMLVTLIMEELCFKNSANCLVASRSYSNA